MNEYQNGQKESGLSGQHDLPLIVLEAGATYIEKGITLDRKQPGIEHLMCIEPGEVSGFVDQMIRTYAAHTNKGL